MQRLKWSMLSHAKLTKLQQSWYQHFGQKTEIYIVLIVVDFDTLQNTSIYVEMFLKGLDLLLNAGVVDKHSLGG